MTFRKKMTGEEIEAAVGRGEIGLRPLVVAEACANGPRDANDLDARIALSWREKTYRFGVECKRLWTPKVVAEAADTVRRNVQGTTLSPMVVVPYLSEERLTELEAAGVSGIDLCGNGVVVVPGELLVFRSGSPNRFRWEKTIKNVYRLNSSVVARAFLVAREFPSLQDALKEIQRLGGKVTLSTVSKACTALDEDLVIEREQDKGKLPRRLRLLQPTKLLGLLADNYAPPAVTRTFRGQFGGSPEDLRERLRRWEEAGKGRVVLTGASSVDAYAAMAREPIQSFYCSNLTSLLSELGKEVKETDRFANMALLETKDEFVYFDRRRGIIASPVQVYLELASGDKRDKETAEQVRRVILAAAGITPGG